jgi:two-component system, sensor histidine kinase and response regulator
MKSARFSLKKKMTLGVCLIVAGITAALALGSLSFFQRQLKENVAAQQAVLVTSIAGNIDDNLAAAQNELVQIARGAALEVLRNPGRAQAFLYDEQMEHRATFDSTMALFSREGAVIAETQLVRVNRNGGYPLDGLVRDSLASAKPAISQPFFSDWGSRHPAIMLTAPLFNPAGQVVGVLAGSIDLTKQNFLGKIARTKVGKTGYLYLFNTQRTIIMHPDEKRILTRKVRPGANKGFDLAVAGFEGTVETVTSKGLPVVATFKHLGMMKDWILAVSLPQAESYAAIERSKQYLAAALFAAIALCVALVWFFMDRITEPLQHFARHVRGLSGKSGAQRLFPCVASDEIGVLAESFNVMVQELDAERAALHKSEQFLTEAQRVAQVGSWEFDPGSDRFTWSEQMYRITGLDRDAFGGTLDAFLELVHPDERSEVQRASQHSLNTGTKFDMEHRFVQPGGTERTVHSVAEVTLDAARRPIRVFGTIQDITHTKTTERERAQAQEALRESEERFRQIAENSQEVFFVVTRDLTQLIYLSPSYRKLWQRSTQSIHQRPTFFCEDVHYEDQARIASALQRLAAGGSFDEDYRIETAGRTRWIHARTYPVRSETGEIYRHVGIAEDVTEQRLAQVQIRNLQQAVEQSPVSIVITDLMGTMEYVNPKFSETTGYSFDEAVGQNSRMLKSWETPAELYRQIWESIRAEVSWHGEILNRKKNGELYWESVSIAPIKNPAGGTTHYLGVKEDITGRRLMEAELVKSKEAAEAANRLKSEFLANMSHEIRTPMNGVMGMADLLGDTDLSPQQLEYVQMVKSSATSLLGVINDILDFSKIEAHKLELEKVSFSVRGSLANIMRTLALRANEKGLELAYQVPAEVPDTLVGDPGRLVQILVNLVSNAVKFTEVGEVVLGVSLDAALGSRASLHFAISDTGIGISAEAQQRIFTPFAQADASTTRSYGGTGLGLTISAQLVEAMGGRIWVESTPVTGSTFHFVVPFELPEGAPGSAVAKAPGFLRDLRVLVVDDNASNRVITEELLKNWGLRPTTADSGVRALSLLAQARQSGEPYPILLIDAGMPGMDGFELVGRIRELERQPGAAIMMLSSLGKSTEAERCRELGMAACLTKPIGQDALLDAILLALGKEPATADKLPAQLPNPAPENRRRLNILLAEDNRINQVTAVGILKKHGHTVLVAANGRAAVDAVAAQAADPFDLILMDVQMPQMDGYQATALIREEEKQSGGHLPIIALTAHAMKGDREKCLLAGMDGYVTKPLNARELLASIDEVLNL